MDKTPKLVSLDQFRRKAPLPVIQVETSLPEPPPTVAQPTSAVGPELSTLDVNRRTQKRIDAAMAAIGKLKGAELAAISETSTPKAYRVRFSAAAVAREAGIGRTQLYEGHSGIQQAIDAARAEIETSLHQRRDVKRPVSKRGLEERIAALEAKHEADLSRLASQQMADLIRRMGPVIDASQRAKNSDAETDARVRHLERQLEAQVAANQILLGAVSVPPGKP